MKLLFLVVSVCALMAAQTGRLPDLFRQPGRVIAEGSNQTPAGNHRLKSYRVEEIRFAQPTEVEIGGRRQTITRAFRVVVTGEGFPVRNERAVVWVDTTPLSPAQESGDLTEVAAITADAGLLRNGATLGFSFGERGPREDIRERLLLREAVR
jgi:hypothetical protein